VFFAYFDNFFQSVYNMGQRPPYVDVLNNRCDRAAICKIRISAHPLMIERGKDLEVITTSGTYQIYLYLVT
jgi:hypothetical protein